MSADFEPDVIVVGAGLAGLVATHELALADRRVLVYDQENRANLGGQAFWSLGGLFMVSTPEQRRLGIRDSHELALADWLGSAGFHREREDRWPRRWAEAYVRFAATEKRGYLRDLGLALVPLVGWAERGDGRAGGHGNSVPRFHLTWGTGPEVVRVFAEPVLEAERRGLVKFAWRHRVDELVVDGGAIAGVRGKVLEPCDELERGRASSRNAVGEFERRAPATIVCSGGIGHDFDLIRSAWPARLGQAPAAMVAGVPAHVDGRMLAISERAGASVVNRDRMWHYVEGLHNWDPIWPRHGIRIIPGPSSIWLDALGERLEAPNFPGFDTLGTLARILATGHAHSWFVLNESIIAREFSLSGSEQNPDVTGKDLRMVARGRIGGGAPAPVQAFKQRGVDFVVRRDLHSLVAGMNELAGEPALEFARVERQLLARDRQLANRYCKDAQLMAIANARRYRGERLRIAKPHRLLDPAHGPLIAVRLNILTRKTLGGLETDLESRVLLSSDGTPIPGLYAAGEVAGFGGGGMHGYRALEGTFLGGCIFSGRAAGRALARVRR
ncbi:MAG: FAD-binding dehydrogenase [Solirubrobacteraceae bacterium]